MGGEGPYVRFNGPGDVQQWTKHNTGLQALTDKQLGDAYTRAHAFLLERAKQLVDLGWKEQATDDSTLLSLSTRVTKQGFRDHHDLQLHLPRAASSFFEPSLTQQWKAMFEHWLLFPSARPARWSSDLYIDTIPPLCDIFYLLQSLIPGMLVIIRIDEIDDLGEEKITRVLPRPPWPDEHIGELKFILGEARASEVNAASNSSRSTSFRRWSYDTYDDEPDEPLDFTACDKECGYCGRCEY